MRVMSIGINSHIVRNYLFIKSIIKIHNGICKIIVLKFAYSIFLYYLCTIKVKQINNKIMNKNLALTFLGKVQNEFIGEHYMGVEETEHILTHIAGEPIKWYDTKIDDGVYDDESEDAYVMKACFSTKDNSIIVGIYYGDVSEKIDYVNVQIN